MTNKTLEQVVAEAIHKLISNSGLSINHASIIAFHAIAAVRKWDAENQNNLK